MSTERDEFISVVRALALPPVHDEIVTAQVAALRTAFTDALDASKRYIDPEFEANAKNAARDFAVEIAALEFFLRARKFPQFRRALCEAVAQETGMNPNDVVALATPQE